MALQTTIKFNENLGSTAYTGLEVAADTVAEVTNFSYFAPQILQILQVSLISSPVSYTFAN